MSSRKQTIGVFLLTLFFSVWHLDQGPNANTVSRAAMVAAIVEQGTLRIDHFADLTNDRALVHGHYYSEKAPLPALLVVPFHACMNGIGLIADSTGERMDPGLLRLGGLLCGSIPFALIITLCWSQLLRRTREQHLVLTWAMFFGSFLFVYSGSFYGHLIAAAFTLRALLDLEQGRMTRAGIFIGCGVLCDYPVVLFAGCWAVSLAMAAFKDHERVKPLLRFILAVTPFAIVLMIYNTFVFGGPFSMGYDHVDSYGSEGGGMIERLRIEALLGSTMSPYRGLLPHMPLLALGLLTWLLANRPRMPRIGLHVAAPVLLTVLFVCSVGMWWGGWAFGPRHLTTVAVLLAYRTLPRIVATRWARWPAIILGTVGLAYAFMAKTTVWYSLPTEVLRPFREVILPQFMNAGFTESQWPVGLGASPALASALFLITFALALFGLYRATRSSDHAPLPRT